MSFFDLKNKYLTIKINELREKHKHLLFFSLVFLVIIYPLVFIWQCGDLTDTGFHALVFQNFFSNSNLGEIGSLTFLSNLIGALWFKLFPNLGIIGLKFLYVIFLYGIISVLYLILRSIKIDSLFLIFTIFCGLAFQERATEFTFSYDIASWFFLISTGCLYLMAVNTKKPLLFLISGVLYSLACLSRLPNVVLVFLFPLISLYAEVYKVNGHKYKLFLGALKQYFLFVFGFFLAIGFFLIILKQIKIYDAFINNLDFLNPPSNSIYGSTHSFSKLFKSYLNEIIDFIPHAIGTCFVMIFGSLIFNYSGFKNRLAVFITLFFLLFGLAFYIYFGFSYSSKIKFLVPAFCLLPLLYSIIIKNKFGLIAVVFIIVGLTQVAGTNTGFFLKFCYGFIVLLPISLMILAENRHVDFKNIKISTKPVMLIGTSVILIFLIIGRLGWVYHVENGIFSRLKTIYPIEHDKMQYVYTTKSNSNYIKELCKGIKRHKGVNNSLFIFGPQLMFYYLTENAPPIKKIWISDNEVGEDELFFLINEGIKKSGKHPIIVDTKQEVLGKKGQEKLSEFLVSNNYKVVEEKQGYIIWKN